MDQAPISPITLRGNPRGHFVEVQLGRDMVITFRGDLIAMLEVNGLQYAPISFDQHDDDLKKLRKGGLDPIMKDRTEIETMVLNYLFDAAIKTRMGESNG